MHYIHVVSVSKSGSNLQGPEYLLASFYLAMASSDVSDVAIQPSRVTSTHYQEATSFMAVNQ